MSAAKEVFEHDGFLDARISDIAERAGLSHGSFYHYFESKEEVFREVAAEVEERLSAPLYSVILDSASTAPPFERIHEGSVATWRLPGRGRIMGVIEQVSRFDDELSASAPRAPPRVHRPRSRTPSAGYNATAWPTSDSTQLSPPPASVPMTYRFPELWFVQGLLDCEFDEGVEQLTRLFVNALGLPEASKSPRSRPDRWPAGGRGDPRSRQSPSL